MKFRGVPSAKPRTGAFAGMRPGSPLAPWSSWRLCCGHDSDLAHRDSFGRRRRRLDDCALECARRALDRACSNVCRFRNNAGHLVAPLRAAFNRRARQLVRTTRLGVDSALRHSLSFGARWPQLVAADADILSGHCFGARFLGGNPARRGLLSPEPALGTGWNSRRVPRARSFSLLLRLGTDASPHVFPDRALGTRAQAIRFSEVFHLYPAQRAVDADRHSGTVLRASHSDRCLHIRVRTIALDAAVVL